MTSYPNNENQNNQSPTENLRTRNFIQMIGQIPRSQPTGRSYPMVDFILYGNQGTVNPPQMDVNDSTSPRFQFSSVPRLYDDHFYGGIQPSDVFGNRTVRFQSTLDLNAPLSNNYHAGVGVGVGVGVGLSSSSFINAMYDHNGANRMMFNYNIYPIAFGSSSTNAMMNQNEDRAFYGGEMNNYFIGNWGSSSSRGGEGIVSDAPLRQQLNLNEPITIPFAVENGNGNGRLSVPTDPNNGGGSSIRRRRSRRRVALSAAVENPIQAQNGANNTNQPIQMTLRQRIALQKFPGNVNSLLGSEIFDGVPVMYSNWSRRKNLRAIIKSPGYLCGCRVCNFKKVINAFDLEIHSECQPTKHPSLYIYFANGKSITDLVHLLQDSTTQENLYEAIKTMSGSVINMKNFRSWKVMHQAAMQ